jgi:hypothetical protein
MIKHIRGLRRRVPVKATVVAALALAAVPAVFVSAAQAQTTLKGTLLPIGPITQHSKSAPTSGSYTASYFQLEEGTTTNISKDSPSGTIVGNSSITAYDADYTPLYAGSTGLTLGSYQSDPSPYGEILNDGLDQQPFDGAEFDTYTTQYTNPPTNTTGSNPAPSLEYFGSGAKNYKLDGVTGYLVEGNLTSWTVNWYADPTLYYNQGANSADVSSPPTNLNNLAAESGADANGNLVGVYDKSSGEIAVEWTSLIDNTTQDGGDAPFDSYYGVWNLVGSGPTG